MSKIKDITDQRFGRLIVVKMAGKNKWGQYQWLCKCDCGNEVVIPKHRLKLKYGGTKSCGCLSRDTIIKRLTTHGLSKHPLWSTWYGMRQRCYYKRSISYKKYGGRGITICDEWLNNFQVFYDWAASNGWKKGLQIDRIDNNGDYEPNNCRFVTNKRNCRNQMRSRIWVIDDVEYPSSFAAAEALGVAHTTIQRWCGTIKGRPQKPNCYSYHKYN